MKLTRAFLIGVIVSLSLAAVMGIWAIVVGHAEGQLILTMLSIGLFSLTSLGASVVLERRVWRIAMMVALGISWLGLLLYVSVIWAEPHVWFWLEETVAKAMGLIAAWSVALPVAGLVALTQFSGILQRVRGIVILLVFAVASLITFLVIAGPDYGPFELWMRLLGVLSILTLLGLISLPILYKIHGIDRKAMVQSTAMELQIVCPRCGKAQTVGTGHSRCSNCKLKFYVDIEEPRCPKCGYLLYRLTSPRCPECGQAISEEEIATQAPAPPQA